MHDKILYDLISPISDYNIIIGGTILPANMYKGTVIITFINAKPLTRADNDFKHIIEQGELKLSAQSSIVQCNYQLDVYKINPANADYIHAHSEAFKIREYLQSQKASELLKENATQIFPLITPLNFLNDFTDAKELVNRAYFEFSLISEYKLMQDVRIFDKIQLNQNLIIGGTNERGDTFK